MFHGTCQASFPPSRTWPWWSTARGKARFSVLFCSLESLVAARNNFDADCPQLTRSILRTILLSLAAMTFFGEGVGYQLPRLAVFQRVALRPLVAHGFEGPLGPLGSPGSATMVRLATLSGAAVPQQQRGPSAGRGGHPRRGLPPTPWAPTACEPLPMSPGPISRAAPRRWVQEGSHAELGSLRAAGEGQNRHLSCPRLWAPPARLEEAAWALLAWEPAADAALHPPKCLYTSPGRRRRSCRTSPVTRGCPRPCRGCSSRPFPLGVALSRRTDTPGFGRGHPPHALPSAGGGGGWGAPGSPFSLRGLRFWLQATLPDFAPGSSHGEFPWRGEEAERCGQAPPPRHVFPPRRPLPHAPRGSWGFGADSIPARFGTYVLQAAPNHGASVQLTWRLHQTHLHGVSGWAQISWWQESKPVTRKKGLGKGCCLVAGSICYPCLGPRMFPRVTDAWRKHVQRGMPDGKLCTKVPAPLPES